LAASSVLSDDIVLNPVPDSISALAVGGAGPYAYMRD
jgi:hypothetical protein